jgi:RND family efflux transporter MFP subunit
MRRASLLVLPFMSLLISGFSTAADIPKIAVAKIQSTTRVQQKTTALERVFDGHIEAVKQATVSAETRGRIEQVLFDIGDRVDAGKIILTMTNTEQRGGLTQAEAALAEAKANLQGETLEYQRITDLYKTQVVAKADVDRITTRLDSAKARVANSTAALNTAQQQLSYTSLKAPYSGIVSARYIDPGEAVQPGTLLMAGYDPSVLRVEVEIPQTLANPIKTLQKARVQTVKGDIIPDKIVIYPTADAATGTIRVRLELPAFALEKGENNLFPGEMVKVAFTVGEKQRLLVPVSSIIYRSEITAVYVVHNGKKQLRQIRVGETFNNDIEVLAGLSADEEVFSE